VCASERTFGRSVEGPGEWCTGDMRAGPFGDMTTTFIVREPDADTTSR